MPEYLEFTVGAVAHGGHCVARIETGPDAGRVVFVRHALPGERVRAKLTGKGKLWRADAVAVLANPSPFRVPTAWPEAGPGGVGGGELAHVSPAGQRLWKAAVIAEQMQRLAGVDVAAVAPNLAVSALTFRPPRRLLDSTGLAAPGTGVVEFGVEPVPGWPSDAGYRTRVDLVVGADGKAGMQQHRSHEVTALSDIPLATERLRKFAVYSGVWEKNWPPGARLTIVAPEAPSPDNQVLTSNQISPSSQVLPPSQPLLLVNGEAADGAELVEQVRYVDQTFWYQLSPNGFWQVHARAPETLVTAVIVAAGDLEARRVLELYSGAGLFTLPIAVNCGRKGKLVTVEGSKSAVEWAKQNVANLRAQLAKKTLPNIEQLAGSVDRVLARLLKAKPQPKFDLVIVDPPRTGLEKGVTEQIAAFEPSRIVYVSCDPAALARDTSRLIQNGYQLTGLRAFDLFPMTHHVEAVAVFDLVG